MSLEKATIQILDDISGTWFEDYGNEISVQFNPTKYTRQKKAQIAEINIPGLDSPLQQFIRGHAEKLTLELYFDTTIDSGSPNDQPPPGFGADSKDVRELTEPIYQLVKIQSETHAPPRGALPLGENSGGRPSFKAVVESVQQEFIFFTEKGIPVRANVNLTLREFRTLEEQLEQLNLMSPDHSRRHVVRQGSTDLTQIAWQEYGDPSFWRSIAVANPMVTRDPKYVAPGTTLWLPPLPALPLEGRE